MTSVSVTPCLAWPSSRHDCHTAGWPGALAMIAALPRFLTYEISFLLVGSRQAVAPTESE